MLAGYSWGGYTAIKLAQQLAKRGLRVRHIILSDAVYRHHYWLGQWRALVPWTKIVIPKNVQEVTWFYQRQNLPRGHNIVALNGKTIINPGISVHGITHKYMDDCDQFHEAVLRIACNDDN